MSSRSLSMNQNSLGDAGNPSAQLNYIEGDPTPGSPGCPLEIKWLADLLRENFKQDYDERGFFVPLDAQNLILSYCSVKKELEHMELRSVDGSRVPASELSSILTYICGSPQSTEAAGTETAKKLFAILSLSRKQDAITEFQRAGVIDKDLPLKRIQQSGGNFQLGRKDSQDDSPLECFRDWEMTDIQNFYNYQWVMISPVFKRKENQAATFYELESDIILPWTEYHKPNEGDADGHSEVRKIAIHKAHHDFFNNDTEFFALKALHTKKKKTFDSERTALNKLNAHENLVPLLASFLHRGTYYFLFPWAEGGNLRAFWGKTDKPIISDSILWVAEQFSGIANGLNQVHNNRSYDAESENDTGDRVLGTITSEYEEKSFGRHGDIKPENILVFTNANNEYGVLKISDFGLTVFHGRRSRSTDHPEGQPRSLTYTAPEAHTESNISRRYDIWCLGCLYLELITWLLKGSDGITSWNSLRFNERGTNSRIYTDMFFKFVGGSRNPVVKKSVSKWIKILQELEECSDFLYETLEFIKTDMLVCDDRNRAECSVVSERFTEMYIKCQENHAYLFTKTQVLGNSRLRLHIRKIWGWVKKKSNIQRSLLNK